MLTRRAQTVFLSVGFGLPLLACLAPVQAAPNQPPFKDAIGFTDLATRLGSALPTGANVTVSQIETSNSTGNYGPDFADNEFVGKTFTLESGPTGVFGHATFVGEYLYGLKTGTSPGITKIDCYELDDWGREGFLRTGSTNPPKVETQDVQNHSWRGSFGDNATDLDALRRFDFSINRDDFVAVVAMSNEGTARVPKLLASSYNAISVGLSNGTHAHGFTTINGSGRIKPEIVAPLNAVSFTTPVVGSSAALLLDEAKQRSALANARHSETVKALLLAGATKSEFPTWDRTETRPLDDVYGAGEVNIDRSFQILFSGEQKAGAGHTVNSMGWDFAQTADLDSRRKYYFDVPAEQTLSELSVILTWNGVVTDGIAGPDWGNPIGSLANLDLRLYRSNDLFSRKALLDISRSPIDNIEHIYMQNLAAGRYAIEVSADTAGVDYALAWYSDFASGRRLLFTAVPEPSTWMLAIVGALGVLANYRRGHGSKQ
jgi:hypothetical protein